MKVVVENTADRSIEVAHQALTEMIAHGEEGFPYEICGFFYGKDGNAREITAIRQVPNVKAGDQRRRFEISPLDYVRAEQFALEKGLDFLGVYHTHPNHPAIPSEHDLAVALPHFSYIILSIQEGKFDHYRSWRLEEQSGKFQEENITSI